MATQQIEGFNQELGYQQEIAALRRQLAERDQELIRRDQIEAQKDQVIAKQSHRITEMEEYQHQIHTVLTNGDMSHRDRVTWCVAHILYGPDIMAGRPFHANMAKIQKMAGVGKNATGELFSAMAEAGGVKHEWDREKYQPEGSDASKWSSAVMITPLPGNALVNTKAAAVRIRQREAATGSATRRIERLVSIAIEACPSCGCGDPEMAQTLLVPRCKACGKLRNSDNLVQTSALRVLEVTEEPVQSNLFPSPAQDLAVTPQEVPISQDTPLTGEPATISEATSNEVPEEPDYIRAQYEEASTGEETSEEPAGVEIQREKQAPPGGAQITATDIQRFRAAQAIFAAQGINRPSGLGSFTFGDIINRMQKIIDNPGRTEDQARWLRQGVDRALSRGAQQWRETTQ